MTSRLGVALVVRDEQGLIEANLRYHRAVGCERAYVLADRCRDATVELAASLPWVRVEQRDAGPEDTYRSDHQVRLMDEALRMAREDGLDWLLHVDADEFAAASDRGDPALGGLLASLPTDVEAVVLPPLEAVPLRRRGGGVPPWRMRWFQRRGSVGWPVLDPRSGRRRRIEDWLGHYKGKSIVRCAVPDARARSAHRWMGSGNRELRTVEAGVVFHFPIIDAGQWHRKHANLSSHPARWRSGRAVRHPKQLWKEIAPAMDEPEAARYFRRWAQVSPWRLAMPVLRGDVVRRRQVERVLRSGGWER